MRPRIGLVVAIIAVATADFTVLLTVTGGWDVVLTAALMFVLTSIALSATLLHVAKYSSYDIGVFKALGAKRGMITASLMVELVMVGLAGTLTGMLVGVGLLAVLSATLPNEASSFVVPASFLTLLLLSCVLGVLAGAFAGVCFAWKKSRETVVEILAHAR